MIGQTFTITENKVTRTLKPVEEYLQHGRRFYDVEDSRTPNKLVPYVADDFDQRFKVTGTTPFKGRRQFNARYRERKN